MKSMTYFGGERSFLLTKQCDPNIGRNAVSDAVGKCNRCARLIPLRSLGQKFLLR